MRHVFVDESCQNDHHYMVLGALCMPGELVREAEAELEAIVVAERLAGSEMKWTTVNKRKLPACQAMIEHYFRSLVIRGATFHALVVDSWALDHRSYNGGDGELGFNKFIYTLLLHKIGKPNGRDHKIIVDLDARTAARIPQELQDCLNNGLKRDLGSAHYPVFKRVAFRDSKSTRLLQLSDILTGCVAWHKNDHDARPEASVWKAGLANHVASGLNLRRLGACSPRGEVRLNVWNLNLRPRGRGAR